MTNIYPVLVKQYALCVYILGTRNFDSVNIDYKEPVKKYAGENYTLEQVDNALVKGYITESEYVDTIKYSQKSETPTA
nr:hypothetical protein [Heyndrickxia oleronia]